MRFSALLTVVCIFWLVAAARGADKAGQTDYLAGLDALSNSQWSNAVQSFTAAVAADDEDAGYHLALGISQLAHGDAAKCSGRDDARLPA